MKKNILVQIGERTEKQIVHHDEIWDDNGNLISGEWDEEREVVFPIMQAQNVDITPEEEADMNVEIPVPEQIQRLKEELAGYDYIGVKIAMGVATQEQYAKEIAYTETLRQSIRALEGEG